MLTCFLEQQPATGVANHGRDLAQASACSPECVHAANRLAEAHWPRPCR